MKTEYIGWYIPIRTAQIRYIRSSVIDSVARNVRSHVNMIFGDSLLGLNSQLIFSQLDMVSKAIGRKL